ncbi:MAG: hypothetical protein ACOCWZ_01625 [Spirochaetota bacterium]
MRSKFLNNDPLPWLCDGRDPSVAYLTAIHIMDVSKDSAEGRRLYDAVLHSDAVKKLLLHARLGVMGDTRHFDIMPRGIMWSFAEAVTRGLDAREEVVTRTAAYIVENFQMEDGGFTLGWTPRVSAGCRTGDMICYLLQSEMDDDRIEDGIRWILQHQRHDGGWLHCPVAGTCDMFRFFMTRRSGKGLRYEDDHGVASCVYATSACCRALMQYKETESTKDGLQRAAEFLLKHGLFFQGNAVTGIRHLCGQNDQFDLPGVPVLSQYDTIDGLHIMAHTGYMKDSRCTEAFNDVMRRQNSNGTWNLGRAKTGMLTHGRAGSKQKGLPDRWVTMRILKVLKKAGELEIDN